MSGKRLETVDEYKYLGMELEVGGWWKRFKEIRIQKARMKRVRACSMAMRAGIVPVKSGVRIWEGLVLPVLEFGSEIWGREEDDEWQEAEEEQRRMAKVMLGCSGKMANEVVLGELGWQTIKARRWMLRLDTGES